ncbi:hypothetical protein J4477_00940 [Candidatus Pacearchaeota archaeon]|nr:hypothetical protein [Candidatus Pacearchaeota archaeon]
MTDVYVVSTYRPRFCGIAEFSANLVKGFKRARRSDESIGNVYVVAIDNNRQRTEYGRDVSLVINQYDESSWVKSANAIAGKDGKKVVLANMEYGIIGDYDSRQDNLTPFMKTLNERGVPVVVQVHTVKGENIDQYNTDVLRNSSKYGKAITIMSQIAGDMLSQEPYSLEGKIEYISHGVRAHERYSETDRRNVKSKYGLDGMIVVANFGYNSPNKGREYGNIGHLEFLKTLSESQRKRVVKIDSHGPHEGFASKEGGKYWIEYDSRFKALITNSGLRWLEVSQSQFKKLTRQDFEKHDVVLINRTLDNKTFGECFIMSDLIINPTRDPWQITSGIRAETQGYGRAGIFSSSLDSMENFMPGEAVIKEVIGKKKHATRLDEKRHIWDKSSGIVVDLIPSNGHDLLGIEPNLPVLDIEEIAAAEYYLLVGNDNQRTDMEDRSREKGRGIPWTRVALRYSRLFQEISEEEESKKEKLLYLKERDGQESIA